MPLNNITFDTVAGGLGRLPAGEDHISAIIMPMTSPAAWGTEIGKRYLSPEEAEQDGITSDSVTYSLLHYFISEYFRMAGPSELYVINESGAGFNADKFRDITAGKVRQVFWYGVTAFAGIAAKVASIKTFSQACDDNFIPAVFITNIKDESTAVTSGVADLRALDADTVSVIIAGDGSGAGKALATSLSVKYIPGAGAVLGALSRAAVHENVGWVGKFPLANATDYQDVVLSDAQKVRAVSATLLNALNDKGYLFIRNIQGVNGSFVNDTHTCTAVNSDFRYIENVRTIQKAKRGIRAILIPDLNSPLEVTADGKLSPDTVQYFTNQTSRPLTAMQNAGEIGAFQVLIDPEQNVLTESTLRITVKIVPRGVARQIVISIGFAVAIQN